MTPGFPDSRVQSPWFLSKIIGIIENHTGSLSFSLSFQEKEGLKKERVLAFSGIRDFSFLGHLFMLWRLKFLKYDLKGHTRSHIALFYLKMYLFLFCKIPILSIYMTECRVRLTDLSNFFFFFFPGFCFKMINATSPHMSGFQIQNFATKSLFWPDL